MMLSKSFTAMMVFLATSVAAATNLRVGDDNVEASAGTERELAGTIDITIKNITPSQPFGEFFIMTHDRNIDPLFELNEKASNSLRKLAENGLARRLVDKYDDDGIAGFACTVTSGGSDILAPGGTQTITVRKGGRCNRLTIAAKALDTNDVFVALNGVTISDDGPFFSPGYDAGTEENNQDCFFIPGPACQCNDVWTNVLSPNTCFFGDSPDTNTNMQAEEFAEGFVHISQGILRRRRPPPSKGPPCKGGDCGGGFGDVPPTKGGGGGKGGPPPPPFALTPESTWLNPMMAVTIN